LSINADIQIAVKNSTTQNWTITDIYNPASEYGGSLSFTKIGDYSEGRGYNARKKEATYWTRKNMTGVTFKTMVVVMICFRKGKSLLVEHFSSWRLLTGHSTNICTMRTTETSTLSTDSNTNCCAFVEIIITSRNICFFCHDIP
jgi:hypothetical protein